MLIVVIIRLQPVEKMQKLSALLHNGLFFIFSYRIHPVATTIYLRALGLISILIFYTLYSQVFDLVVLDVPLERFTPLKFYPLNVFSFIPVDVVSSVVLIGFFLSFLLLIGIAPFLTILSLTIIYASLLYVFPTFLSYQWDIFYIELLICSLFLFSPNNSFIV